jgi:hypothetical protein
LDFQTLPVVQVSTFHKCKHAKDKNALCSEVVFY